MDKVKEEQLYDLRTLEQYLRRGKVNQKDYHAWLKTISDSATNADYIEIVQEPVSGSDTTQPEAGLTFRPI